MKTIICANILYRSIVESWTYDEANIVVKKAFGNYWSLINVFQHLTGKEALEVLNKLPDDYLNENLTKDRLTTIIGIANAYWANILPHKTINNGIKVKNFLESNSIGFKDQLQSLLYKKLN